MITEDLWRISSNQGVSSGGRRYYVPISIDEACIPVVNKLFDSMEECMEFYQAYGRAGFNEKSSQVKRGRTVSNRCGCGAKIILRIVSGKTYKISTFVEEDNHDLVPKSGVSKSHSFMKEHVGGYANVGAIVRDFRNFSRDLKAYVGERDAQMIINKFKAKHVSCESFYYAYDVDSEDHLTKLFWADVVARRNYELYGDVVSFDATFDTNMYNMVFCPFTWVDKHDRCVTFGFSLLSKEDIPHFQWTFDHF
ncbi:hypothetical protein POM88_018255 [Heracleum sosnowskyi]|uniref:MULE transposase domain-containing protein n=1 Tax=Heracleum sosnowskyi TaxID=360622 RepID=A0AAD8MZ32_9APIA|nr:hypothetical protein POM88_018255 [Heracleum sosnowskyi]